MQTYIPTTAFITPPENQGQIVTRSYALDQDELVIIEKIHDGSDGNVTYHAYAYPDSDYGEWDPWNGSPETGDYLGECRID